MRFPLVLLGVALLSLVLVGCVQNNATPSPASSAIPSTTGESGGIASPSAIPSSSSATPSLAVSTSPSPEPSYAAVVGEDSDAERELADALDSALPDVDDSGLDEVMASPPV